MPSRGKQNVYQSIVEELKRLIAAGVYVAGEKLPSVRTLALERGINPNTVQRAYVQLEAEGLLTVFPKKGAFVAEGREKSGGAAGEILAVLRAWKGAGVTKSEMDEAVLAVCGGDEND